MTRQMDALQRKLDERKQEAPADGAVDSLPGRQEAADAQSAMPANTLSQQDRLSFSGDMRLRYEHNTGPGVMEVRNRGVIRGRLQGEYALNNQITLGARMVTGNPDDPNTADVTLSNFNDDLQVSLDRLFVNGRWAGADFYAGKFPQIFERTDLVWDGDVNIQGIGAERQFALGPSTDLTASSVYFLIDEDAVGPDSQMAGAQLALEHGGFKGGHADLSVGYYDYHIGSLTGADQGDLRSNRTGPDGKYLSDFRLVDVIAALSLEPFGGDLPLTFKAEYVKNFGAVDDENSAFAGDIFLRSTEGPGDWRLRYGYAETETDAVFAAFSNDNIPLATDYRLHTAAFDYALSRAVSLNLTWYRFRPNSGLSNTTLDEWRDRVRLNLVFGF
ncbi:putative porin [Henriciella sp.]|uniref:putative porin n=1 Tax=Henriciella sp. TaxID=1968823 RepID=UPI00262A9541|nr:putative porin [Henriciella sp.]